MMNVKPLPQYLALTNIGTFFKLLLFHHACPSGIRDEFASDFAVEIEAMLT